jgi:hypothetical protein
MRAHVAYRARKDPPRDSRALFTRHELMGCQVMDGRRKMVDASMIG